MQSFRPIAQFSRQLGIIFPFLSFFYRRLATVICFGTIGLSGAISIAWFLGEQTLTAFFLQWNGWQNHPPFWIEVPEFVHPSYLFLPSIMAFLVITIVTKISPQPQPWSRVIVIGISLALTLRYVAWRSLSTLNLSNPLDGTFSLLLLLMELVVITSYVIQLYLMLTLRDRLQEADHYSQAVIEQSYLPSVDILIPTYNESAFILRRTIIGCQALDYEPKKIYVLDDTNRQDIKKLANQLGCGYIARPDHYHAKAGNLNHAIPRTNGELIVVFDADFIPTKNFLQRTVGFFQNPTIALVQTPQSFYNPDPIAYNLGLEKELIAEEEVFYRQIQLMKDGAKSVVCAGTSFVVRRSALQEVNGFVTESLSEDYFTGIRLAAKGYEIVYLPEKLSAGLAAESMSVHLIQRLRWGRGTLQAFFIPSNPLTISGLTLKQRLGHLEGLLNWFGSFPKILFLLTPLLLTFLNIHPFKVSSQAFIYTWLPFFLVQITTFSWLNFRSRSIFVSEISNLVHCFPLAINTLYTLIFPFKTGFNVTPKGIARNQFYFHWKLALPLIILLGATVTALVMNLILSPCLAKNTLNLGLVWNSYNTIMLSLAILSLIDRPKPNPYEELDVKHQTSLEQDNYQAFGVTQKLSEGGAWIELNNPIYFSYFSTTKPINITFKDINLTLSANLQTVTESHLIYLQFTEMSLSQYRQLIELLFCQPGRWIERKVNNEWMSLGLLLRVFWQHPLFSHWYSKFFRKTSLKGGEP